MFEKANVIKAVTQVSIIVIALITAYFIICALDKNKCNCQSVVDETVTTDTSTVTVPR